MMRRPLLSLLLLFLSLPALAQNERHCTFHYAFTVKNVSPGERLRVWIPLAHSDAFQEVKVISKSGDLPLNQVRQPEYGNEVLYAEASRPDKDEYNFSVDYDVVRKEHVVPVNGKPAGSAPSANVPRVELARFLEPNR